jgi:hypothetical protein
MQPSHMIFDPANKPPHVARPTQSIKMKENPKISYKLLVQQESVANPNNRRAGLAFNKEEEPQQLMLSHNMKKLES